MKCSMHLSKCGRACRLNTIIYVLVVHVHGELVIAVLNT